MSGYNQAELSSIFQAAGLGETMGRRFSDIIIKYYSIGTPDYSYETHKELALVLRHLIKIAIACYGKHYSPAAFRTAIYDLGYYGRFAAFAAEVIVAVYATIAPDIGNQVLAEPNFATNTKWVNGNGWTFSNEKAVAVHNDAQGTLSQVSTDFLTAAIASRWYRLDYTISGVALGGGSEVPTAVITAASGLPATNEDLEISNGKYTALFYTASDVSGDSFIITPTLAHPAAGFTIDDLDLRLIGTSLSVDPLSENYVKPYISSIIAKVVQFLRLGQFSIYNK